jgi:hypothetical protein
VDTEDWDSSVGLNNPGQSGDVNDPPLSGSLPTMVAWKILSDLLFSAESRIRHREDLATRADARRGNLSAGDLLGSIEQSKPN